MDQPQWRSNNERHEIFPLTNKKFQVVSLTSKKFQVVQVGDAVTCFRERWLPVLWNLCESNYGSVLTPSWYSPISTRAWWPRLQGPLPWLSGTAVTVGCLASQRAAAWAGGQHHPADVLGFGEMLWWLLWALVTEQFLFLQNHLSVGLSCVIGSCSNNAWMVHLAS